MKLTLREKVMLGILGIAIITGLFVNYVIIPEFTHLYAVRSQKSALEEQVRQVDAMKNTSSTMQKNIEDLKAKAEEKTIRFYPALPQDSMLLLADDLIKKSGLQADSMTIIPRKLGEITTAPIQGATKPTPYPLKDLADSIKDVKTETGTTTPAAGTQTSPSAQSGSQSQDGSAVGNKTLTESAGVTIQYRGEYEQLIRLITEIQGLKKAVVVENLTINGGTAPFAGAGAGTAAPAVTASSVSGSLNLMFYSVPKLTDNDKSLMTWPYSNEYGKANPFR